MRAVRLTDSAQGPVLVEADAPLPQPGPDEVLVRVYAAGVTPTELIWQPTTHTASGEHRAGAIPGHEFSGCVAAVGPGIDPLEIGHGVFGMNDWYAEGATAEYCVAPFSSLAPKPRRLTHVDAASIPIGGLTAWQGLFDRAKLQAGETVLVHGGAGAVGLFAVQLAKLHGAHVIATASARNLEFVKSLGAESAIDYGQSRFEDVVRDVDVVFDTVGGETLERSWRVLKPGGRMVTVAATEEPRTDPRVKAAFFIVEPNRRQLIEIADMVEAGRLRTVVDAVVPLEKAADAYSGSVDRRGRGKLVVRIEAQEC